MTVARQVSPLDRDADEKLVAILEAVNAPLPRAEIFARVDDDFEDEQACAKALGRLVTSGRIFRASRERPGKGEEFVYSAKPIDRTALIAAVAAKVQAAPKPKPETPTEPANEEQPMPKKAKVVDANQYLAALPAERGWVKPRELAKELGVSREAANSHLRELADDGKLQRRGSRSGLAYAAPGVAEDATSSAPAKGGKREPKRKKKTGARAVRSPRSERPRNLAEFGAHPSERPQLPAPAPGRERPICAINDQGALGITKGKDKIALDSDEIAYVVDFLERVQHVWRKAA